MLRKDVLFFVISVLYVSLGEKLPDEFKTCKRDIPNFTDCIKDAIEDAFKRLDNGIPSLDVPPLQPLNVPNIKIGEGKGAVNVVQNYKNFNMYNIKNLKITKIDCKLEPDSLNIALELFTPEVRFEADYNLNGHILLLPIVGDGKCVVILENLKTNTTITSESYEKKGKKYLKVTDFPINLTPGRVRYNFENLFNGDERLGKALNKVVNDNWKDVYDDVKEQYESALGTVFKDYANKIFSKVPYDDLF